jgi:predicted nucleic acid-binding protein
VNRYLLDTNHVGEAIGRVSVVRDRIQQLHRQGVVFGTCGPVLCELLVGVVQRKDAAKTRRRLDVLLQVVRIWPTDLAIADRYAEVFHELQKGGTRFIPG